MNKKSFFLGFIAGAIVTFIGLVIVGIAMNKSHNNSPIKYLEQPVSYEDKTETSFKVFQLFDDSALASEISDSFLKSYYGNTVLLLGEDYYCDQIVKVKSPKRIGTYSYTNKGDRSMTVPVIDGTFE